MNEINIFYLMALIAPIFLFIVILILYRIRKTINLWVKIILWNIFLCLFFISILFTGCETYYRFIYDETSSFSLDMISQRWFKRYFVYNKNLYRDNVDYSFGKGQKKQRITFIGDSFTVGHGIKIVDNRFANIIRNAFQNWEIHVIAHIGDNTINEMKEVDMLDTYNYQFEYVVLCYCLNDISDLSPDCDKIMNNIKRYSDKGNSDYFIRNSFFLNMYYYRMIAKSVPDVYNYYHFVKDLYNNEKWDMQKQILTDLKSKITNSGGKLLVATFPFFNAMHGKNNYEFEFAHKKLDSLWKELNVPHLDLLETYGNYSSKELMVNKYDAHPNEFAHKLAAGAISDFLQKEINKDTILKIH